MSDLLMKKESGWNRIDENEKKQVYLFSENYMKFISAAKTEREACSEALKAAERAGFVSLDTKEKLNPGDKVYCVNRGKGIVLAVIGSDKFDLGMNIVGAHIDVPRIDLKPNPLYEDNGLAFFKTHYYGGIKKYQWMAIPLALHGVVVKADGSMVDVCIGEDHDDPVFCITDLLPHLAQDQMQKKMSEAITGEGLNVLIGNIPHADKDAKDKVKLNVITILNEKYGICEEDFVSAELEIVPAFCARDVGFDRSMVAAYGHDDRVCSYTALEAVLNTGSPKKTAICLLVDKEEVGSMGNTGMQSRFFENTVAKMMSLCYENYSDLKLRETLSKSVCLSADVGVAFDPNYSDVVEKRNTAFMNHGLMLTKFTGSRGKSGASDASAELVGKIRKIFNDSNVLWQMGALGKVDLGGGGTIAQYVANLDMDVIDCGVPLFSMHSPYEIAGKIDIYMAYKGYRAFLLSV